jgi:hypothetical protein
MINVALPVLVRVTVCGALVVPTAWEVANVTLAGERFATGAVTPVPVSEIVCGLLAALSTKVTEPTALPAVVGVKVTLMVQIPPEATGATQVLVSPKPALATMLVKVRGALPVLVTVAVCGALVVPMIWSPKLRLEVESTTADWSTPVPVSRIIWGLSGALSVRVSESTLGPGEVGVKVTPISQFDGGVVAWRGTVQPLAWTAKSPLAIALVKFNAAVPVFVTVRNRGELVTLTA